MKKYFLNLAAVLAVVALALPSQQAFAKRAIKCSDGTTSTATGRGACSGHGGVLQKAKAAKTETAAKTEKRTKTEKSSKAEARTQTGERAKTKTREKSAAAEAPAAAAPTRRAGPADAAGATAKCKDGTYSHAKHHQGACSKHGGVAEWLAQ